MHTAGGTNWHSQIVEPVSNPGQRRPREFALGGRQAPVNELPDAALIFLLGSRYCDTDRLAHAAGDGDFGLAGALVSARPLPCPRRPSLLTGLPASRGKAWATARQAGLEGG